MAHVDPSGVGVEFPWEKYSAVREKIRHGETATVTPL
jgi:hypothetical protein